MNAAELIREYLARSWRLVPYAKGTKALKDRGWAKKIHQIADDASENLGLILGFEIVLPDESHGWIVDVDIDFPPVAPLASEFLPQTTFIYGRESKRTSHFLYLVDRPIKTRQRKIDSQMLVELRGVTSTGTLGAQSMLPGSIHPNGELIEWQDGKIPAGQPPLVSAKELVQSVNQLAAFALLLHQWGNHEG